MLACARQVCQDACERFGTAVSVVPHPKGGKTGAPAATLVVRVGVQSLFLSTRGVMAVVTQDGAKVYDGVEMSRVRPP